MIRVMIVDDERQARETLVRLIDSDKSFQIVEEVASGHDALQKLKTLDVDVIFLDVEMPGLSGLDVTARLAKWDDPPLVVFATAYDQYAIKAFETNAVDYVLKPFEPARVQKAFERIKLAVGSKSSSREKLVSLEKDLVALGKIQRMVAYKPRSKTRIVLDPREVLYFEAKYHEVCAHLGDKELMLRSTLQDVLTDLAPSQFVQTHKAYIVNLEMVDSVEPMFNDTYVIHLKGGKGVHIPLSRKYVPAFKSILGGW